MQGTSPGGLLFFRILCLLLLSGSPTMLPAQQQWLFSHFGKREGLASDRVMSVQQDHRGYIWIATTAGLERFDGQRFLLFRHKPNDPNSIPDDHVLQALLDRRNRLWLLFQNNLLGYIDPHDLHFRLASVRINNETLKRTDAQLFMTNLGQMLLLVKHRGIYGYNEDAREFTQPDCPFPLPEAWPPVSLSQDTLTHTFWIGCDSGLVKYDPSARTLCYRGHNPSHDPIIDHFAGLRYVSLCYMDRNGRFWTETWPSRGWYELYSYDSRNGRERHWEKNLATILRYKYHDIHFFGEQQDGTIWIAGTNLLASLRPGNDSFEILASQLTGEFTLHYDLVEHMLEDHEHNLWISTDKGLYRFNPGSQVFHTITNRLPGKDTTYTPDVTDIIQVKNGDIYVTTWGNGVFAYDSNFHPVRRPLTYASRHSREIMTWCIHQRANGDLWRGNQDGMLAIYHAATGIDQRWVPPVFKGSTIRQIVEDSTGDLWLGTQKGDLVKWQASSNSFTNIHNLGSPIHRLYTDRHGDIWACTFRTGLFTIAPSDGRILFHYSSESRDSTRLPEVGVTDIVQESDSLFAISSGGLQILNEYTHRIHRIEPVNGVPSNEISNLVQDKNGYVWVASPNSLCKINIYSEARSTFNEADGIGSNSFNIGSTCRLSDGRIAIGTAHDLMVFHPRDITTENSVPPDIEITNMALMNRWLSMDSVSYLDRLELPYDQNSLRIVFSTLTYQNTFTVFYRMEGMDKDWLPSESNEAIYNYMPPGDYTFRIEARNSIGIPSVHQKVIRIRVVAPFWRTWGFYAFIALAATGLLYWFDRQRMQRKESLQKIRTNISDNLHEDIHTTLQHINVLSEIARIKAERAPEQSINYINEIHHKSRTMIIALEDMLWSIDPVNDSMIRAIHRMKEFAAALRQQTGAAIAVHEDERVLALRPDMRTRHELMLVYRLALRLLVEEMKARQTTIQLDFERSQLMLSIFAAGIRPDNTNHSTKLLEEMKTRARSIAGTLDMQFDEKGAAIIFIFPSIS